MPRTLTANLCLARQGNLASMLAGFANLVLMILWLREARASARRRERSSRRRQPPSILSSTKAPVLGFVPVDGIQQAVIRAGKQFPILEEPCRQP